MRYETTTILAPAEALERAQEFFGREYGLTERIHGSQEIGFEGGGGHVLVRVIGERPTTLELETREWDAAVDSFLTSLPR
jgi:hypothetical protein